MDAQKWAGALHSRGADAFWAWFSELIRLYFRVDIEGIEKVPRRGPAILISNHSGFAGADAIMLSHLLTKKLGRTPRILAHRAFFDWSESVKRVAESFGLRRATKRRGLQVLDEGHLLLIFPEGEDGNFKPSRKRYQLQPFRTGFLRLALDRGVPIVPCLVIGAEESHLNLGQFDFRKYKLNVLLPVPFNLIPLPAKWKIVFMDPITLKPPQSKAKDRVYVYSTAFKIQTEMQRRLNEEVAKRPYVYFPIPARIKQRLLGMARMQ